MASNGALSKRIIDSFDDTINQKRLCTSSPIETITSLPSQSTSSLSENEDCKRELHLNSSELDVGISEYISDLPGFYAVIKERYSDFLVNELDIYGKVVRLTDMDKPKDVSSTNLVDALDEDSRKQIQDLVDDKERNVVIIEVTNKDKLLRKKIHEAIRKEFQGLDSTTEDRGETKVIIVKKAVKSKDRRFQPQSQGNYIQFVLYKENRDTMDAINTIASFLRIPSKSFSYAGTKDKRGKTSQLASVYRLPAEKLLRINDKFNMIKVGNIMYKNEQMRLGQLLGNQFIVILRQLKGETEHIEKAITSLESKGFINYYGMQRFGTSSVATHSIGRYLLLGEWKNAINLILKPRLEDDSGNLAESQKIWKETGDAKKAYHNLKYKSSIEGKLLEGLSVHNENDFVNALNAVPRNTRLMYIHSYQSYVWNQVVSRRIKKYGVKVIPGDLVSDSQNVTELSDLVETSETTFDQERKHALTGNVKKHALTGNVKQVTEENVSQYSIYDVLFPLPGHNIKYPSNETKDWYDEILCNDGMDLSNFESKVKTYSLSGSYRRIVVIPKEVKWEIIPYNDVSLPLALSDLDVLQGVSLTDPPSGGSLQALKLEFKLPSSSYATMAIREILKCDTCYSFQKISAA